MVGYRKWSLGVIYLILGAYLALESVKAGTDGTAAGVMLAGLATGVGVVVYGNVAENRSKAATGRVK